MIRKTILDEEDIIEVIAKYFNCDNKCVRLKTVREHIGAGTCEKIEAAVTVQFNTQIEGD